MKSISKQHRLARSSSMPRWWVQFNIRTHKDLGILMYNFNLILHTVLSTDHVKFNRKVPKQAYFLRPFSPSPIPITAKKAPVATSLQQACCKLVGIWRQSEIIAHVVIRRREKLVACKLFATETCNELVITNMQQFCHQQACNKLHV